MPAPAIGYYAILCAVSRGCPSSNGLAATSAQSSGDPQAFASKVAQRIEQIE
jgi:hypothetical protein